MGQHASRDGPELPHTMLVRWWAVVAAAGLVLGSSSAGPDGALEHYRFASGSNSTVHLGEGVVLARAEGRLTWGSVGVSANFSVFPGLVTRAEVEGILAALPGEFDEDSDSVDQMPTFEFYLEKHGSFEAIGSIGGKPDQAARVRERRRPVREALARLTGPVVAARVLPLVNALPACGGRCRLCFSLVRRYLETERRSHRAHFDIQALATVVVSLSPAHAFHGGLYVAAEQGRRFLALQQGDAVLHESDLLHGVSVLGGARWSWVMWFKDAADCEGSPAEWHSARARGGDPLAQFLHAQRAHMRGAGAAGSGRQAARREREAWLRRSAAGGFPRAMNELGLALRAAQPADGTAEGPAEGPAALQQQAAAWFAQACEAGLGDACYNLGVGHLATNETLAVECFQRGAQLGSHDAMYNLGLAHLKGAGVEQSHPRAAALLEAADSADAMLLLARLYGAAPLLNRSLAQHWLERAGAAGHPEACEHLAHLHDEHGRAAEAGRWYLRAARHGSPLAQRILAERRARDAADL